LRRAAGKALGRRQTLAGEGGIDLAPDARALGADRREIQRCGRAGRIEQAGLGIVGRGHWYPRPLGVVDLVMRHAAGVDFGQGQRLTLRLGADRNLGLHPVGNLHLQQELDLVTGLVQQVVDPVARFRNIGLAVGEGVRGLILAHHRPLIGVQQHPHGNAAVDDIFPMVAGIIPAAGDVERIVATGPGDAGPVRAGETGRDLVRMSGLTRQVRACDVFRQDRDAGAVLIEIGEGVVFQAGMRMLQDRERAAFVRSDDQPVALAIGLKRLEVDGMHALSGRCVLAEDL